jgi:hypothetical protein
LTLLDRIREHNAKRPHLRVPLSSFLAQYEDDGHAIALVPLVQREIDEATEAALEYRKRALKSLPENHQQAFLDDPTVLENAKQIEMLWRACRKADDVKATAFPSSAFIREHMTSEEIAILLRCYDLAEQKASRASEPMTIEQRTTLATMCAMSANTDSPDVLLASMPSAVVNDWAIWLCREWLDARTKAAPVGA